MTVVLSLMLALVLQSGSTPVRSLDAGAQASFDNPRQIVIQSAAEWNAFWPTHAPGRQVPPVDFTREMVVAVFLGSRPTAGYSVEIGSARAEEGVLVVRFKEHRPPSDAMTAQVITSPFHIVAVPKVAGVARFVADPN